MASGLRTKAEALALAGCDFLVVVSAACWVLCYKVATTAKMCLHHRDPQHNIGPATAASEPRFCAPAKLRHR